MIRKRCLAMLTAGVVLILLLTHAAALAGNVLAHGSCGENVTWSLDANGRLTIAGEGAMADYDDFTECPWYEWNMNVFSVSVTEGVETIGRYAFSGFWGLETLALPQGLQTIGDYAFSDCYSLLSCDVPSGVSAIGSSAFARCYNLTDISLPSSVSSIGKGAFDECYSLTAAVVKNSYAHQWCQTNGLPFDAADDSSSEFAYTLSNGRATITGCHAPQPDITIPSCVDGFDVAAIGDDAFANCSVLQSVVISEGIAQIGERAFGGCSGLESVVLPNSLSLIADTAFEGCYNLTAQVTPDSYAQQWCATNSVAFDNGTGGQSPFTYAVSGEGVAITGYAGQETQLVIPETIQGLPVQAIGPEAFAGNLFLQSVCLPQGMVSIGEYAFAGCYSLVSVNVPESVEEIADTAFTSCFNVTLTVSSGSYAHRWCVAHEVVFDTSDAPLDGLQYAVSDGKATVTGYTGTDTEVTVPAETNGYPVIAVGTGAFAACYDLSLVSLPETIVAIGANAFAQCYNLRSVNLPAAITTIGDGAFDDCYSLSVRVVQDSYAHIWCISHSVECETPSAPQSPFDCAIANGAATIIGCHLDDAELTIPSEINGYPVTAIGDHAFADRSALLAVTLPDSVTAIGEGAFAGCTGLLALNLPQGVSFIHSSAFEGCARLTALVSAGSYAQRWCEQNGVAYDASGGQENDPPADFRVFELPLSLRAIEAHAFANTNAEMIIVPDGCTSIGEGAFANSRSLQRIFMPDSVAHIAADAFEGCGNVLFICESQNAAAAFAAQYGYDFEIAS